MLKNSLTTTLFTCLIMMGSADALLHQSYRPIVGNTPEERQAEAMRQCTAACRKWGGWREQHYVCNEKPLIAAQNAVYYEVLNCLCECKDDMFK